jgi:hypothetical protein
MNIEQFFGFGGGSDSVERGTEGVQSRQPQLVRVMSDDVGSLMNKPPRADSLNK